MQENRVFYIWQLLNMFWVVIHPSSGAQNTVSTVSGINETAKDKTKLL